MRSHYQPQDLHNFVRELKSDGIVPVNRLLFNFKSSSGSVTRDDGMVPVNLLSPRRRVSSFLFLSTICSGNVPVSWFEPSRRVSNVDNTDHDSGIEPTIRFCSAIKVVRSVRRVISKGRVPAKPFPSSRASKVQRK